MNLLWTHSLEFNDSNALKGLNRSFTAFTDNHIYLVIMSMQMIIIYYLYKMRFFQSTKDSLVSHSLQKSV